ncbi:hypothetical protein PRIC1_007457 [Phytophthora ramorum]|uniref:Uncharacterized protein n=1 Tax=Phytophthora ramorum TaxID=164328 RepID=H3GM78_PHYRM|nr:hypothetical protein KRP23_2375 [Phytophthora ramorum]KAH7502299.1 hypothetical protein KRP22_7768 [Phytophthora ramorum]
MAISVLHRIRVIFRANCDDPTSKQPTTSSSADPEMAKNAPKTQAKTNVAKWKLSVRKTEATTPLLAGMTRDLVRATAARGGRREAREERQERERMLERWMASL